jgi:protein associated with RNAse G/E
MNMQPISIKSYKADGNVHRFCEAQLELVNDVGCVVWTHPGCEMHTGTGGMWITDSLVRALLVFGARLDLLEIHEPDGTPRGIYMNVTSPIRFDGDRIWYTDHELDVYKPGSDAAVIHDEDEFGAAIDLFSYSGELIDCCRDAARLGVSIADGWRFRRPSEMALQQLAELLGKSGGE